jgi:hypothetical protein
MRDEAYLAWVRTQPSCISGQMGCEAHHPIGQRYSQSKCSDYLAIPLTHAEHMELHWCWGLWEAANGSQWMHAARTLERAIRAGFRFPTAERYASTPRARRAGSNLSSPKQLPRTL